MLIVKIEKDFFAENQELKEEFERLNQDLLFTHLIPKQMSPEEKELI